jgi:hypothetical protein
MFNGLRSEVFGVRQVTLSLILSLTLMNQWFGRLFLGGLWMIVVLVRLIHCMMRFLMYTILGSSFSVQIMSLMLGIHDLSTNPLRP